VTPRVSVLTATYNAVAFIDRTIDCVLSQTFEDFEWVLVDDESSDGTPARLRAQGDPRMRVQERPNGGPSAARNTGLASARGEIVVLLDHDDMWSPTRLEVLVAALDAQPTAGFASTDMWVGDPDSDGPARTILENPDCAAGDLGDERTWLRGCGFSASTAAVRREVFARHGAWREDLVYAQDWELVLRFWMGGERAVMVPEPLGWTVVHPGQLSGNRSGTFADRRKVLSALGTPAALALLAEWEVGEARRRLAEAVAVAPGDPRRASGLARWALRRRLGAAERAMALAYAANPRAACWAHGVALRALRRR
jgi:GT2 family glycosyltransferase